LSALVVHPADRPLTGSVPVPSDKSIGHRALLFAALCEGETRIRGFSGGADNESTAAALASMGVAMSRDKNDIVVRGGGLFGLQAPRAPIDCGNSGTTMRLLCGILAAQSFSSELSGDASLSSRPMKRVVAPLRARGADIEGRGENEIFAPLKIHAPKNPLRELEHALPVASAQVKSALLLSGLFAHGATRLREPTVSRDHTERLLLSLGAPIRTLGPLVELDPARWNGKMEAFDAELPGDLSAAAFLLVAAQIVSGSRTLVRNVGTNPTRAGILEIARDMGALVEVEPKGERNGEPFGNLHFSASENLHGTRIGGETTLRAIDEIPAAIALAARANGTTEIADAAELRVKESDRIAAMCSVLRAFGVEHEEKSDGMIVRGKKDALEACVVDSRGDHRIAMSAAVLALVAKGPCRIENADNIATSFPKFVGTLRALGARVDVE